MSQLPGRVGPHLFATALAVALAAMILFAARWVAVAYEDRTVSIFAPEDFPLKNQGLAFQRAAARAAGVLPLYGSSELVIPDIPERAPAFFQNGPTGFQVSPVGKGGGTALIILQKIGSLAREFAGRKVAISLSSIYFFGEPRVAGYEASFSLFAVSRLTFGHELDLSLKRDIAARLLEFPPTVDKNPLLNFALLRLASGKPLDLAGYWLVWPLGTIQNGIFDLQDHLATLRYIWQTAKPAPVLQSQTLDWPALMAKADEAAARAEASEPKALETPPQPDGESRDDWFREWLGRAREWGDLDLLLRVLSALHAQPLLISTPIDGQYYDRVNVSRAARQEYYGRIQAVARRYGFALFTFEEHDEDTHFFHPPALSDRRVHLSAKGWLFYDRVLDDFFHDRLSSPLRAGVGRTANRPR